MSYSLTVIDYFKTTDNKIESLYIGGALNILVDIKIMLPITIQ